jgi:transposase-like protein
MDVWQDEEFIICPYCGNKHEPFNPEEDEFGDEYKCFSCGKMFNLQVSIITTFTSTKLEGQA